MIFSRVPQLLDRSPPSPQGLQLAGAQEQQERAADLPPDLQDSAQGEGRGELRYCVGVGHE